MKCSEACELMNDYLDGELPKILEEDFVEHINNCPNCRKELESLKLVIDTLSSIEPVELPQNFHESLMSKIENIEMDSNVVLMPKKINFKNINWKKLSVVAAAVLVICVAGVSINNLRYSIPNTETSTARNYSAQSRDVAGGGGGASPSALNAIYEESAPGEYYEEKASVSDAAIHDSEGSAASPEEDINTRSVESYANDSSDEAIIIDEKKIIKNSNVSIEVKKFDEAVNSIRNICQTSGGYVEYSDSYIYYEDSNNDLSLKEGYMTIKTPRETYDSVKKNILELGDVKNDSETVSDITSQYLDTAGRLKTKRIEEERLLSLLEKAESVEDIIKIEERLSYVRADIENYTTTINNWDKLVSYSTISIEIREVQEGKISTIPSDFITRVKESFIDSCNIVIDAAQNSILSLVTYSIPIVIIAVVIILIIILFNKKKRNK